MSASSIRTLMSAAADAVASEDWSTAVSKAEQALALLAGMPNGSGEGRSLEWTHERVEAFLIRMRRNLSLATQSTNETGIFGEQKIQFARPTGLV